MPHMFAGSAGVAIVAAVLAWLVVAPCRMARQKNEPPEPALLFARHGDDSECRSATVGHQSRSTLALTGAYTLDTYYQHARNMGQRATCLAVVFDGTLLHHESVRLDPLFANLRATSSARSRHQWRCHYHTGHGGYFNLELDFGTLRCVLANIGPFLASGRFAFVS